MESYRLTEGPLVAIIGAGFGGILAAISLKEKHGFNNFVIFEKESDIGGTWRDNTYPGSGCDIASFFYCLSEEIDYEWTNTCASQADILSYMKHIVSKHHLDPHISLNTKVAKASWDESKQAYDLVIEDQKGIQSTVTANFIISAIGSLHVPRMPSIPGLNSFGGVLKHSAQWDASVDLTGKRVAVIGNGSTGTQIMSQIPKIEDTQITHFYRSCNWVIPRMNYPLPNAVKWIAAYIPFSRWMFRFVFWMVQELCYWLIFKFKWMRSPMKKLVGAFMLASTPKEYHDILIPEFPVGCRRIIFDPGYLEILHRPNVDLRVNAISEICPEGIITTNGETLPFDVIVCATGFVVDKFPIPIRGRENDTIQQYYDKTGGPNAYLGMTTPSFPNLAMLFGPNTVTGFTSVLFFEEVQMQYINELLKPVLGGVVSALEVTKQANAKYNKWIDNRLQESVYTEHSSWYRVGSSGRTFAIFPASGIRYWNLCYSVDWSSYTITGLKEGHTRLSQRATVAKFGFVAALGALLLASLGLARFGYL